MGWQVLELRTLMWNWKFLHLLFGPKIDSVIMEQVDSLPR